jgi:hypothetical protein
VWRVDISQGIFAERDHVSMKTSTRRTTKSATKPNKEPKLSRTHAPADLSPVNWQRRLRRQFGREQQFGLENLTGEPFFSEFRVSNLASKSSYRVAIRGRRWRRLARNSLRRWPRSIIPMLRRIRGSSAIQPQACGVSRCSCRHRKPRGDSPMRFLRSQTACAAYQQDNPSNRRQACKS